MIRPCNAVDLNFFYSPTINSAWNTIQQPDLCQPYFPWLSLANIFLFYEKRNVVKWEKSRKLCSFYMKQKINMLRKKKGKKKRKIRLHTTYRRKQLSNFVSTTSVNILLNMFSYVRPLFYLKFSQKNRLTVLWKVKTSFRQCYFREL